MGRLLCSTLAMSRRRSGAEQSIIQDQSTTYTAHDQATESTRHDATVTTTSIPTDSADGFDYFSGDERELRSRSRRPGQRQSSNASTDPPTPAEGGGRKLRFLGALFTGKDAPVSSPVLDDSIPTLAPSSTACAALPAPVSILTVPVSSPTVPVSSPTIDSLAPPATAIPSTPAIPSPTQEIVSPTPPTITPPSKLVSPASATVVPPQTAIPTLATVTPSPVAAPTPTQSWGRRCSKELLRFVQTLRCISTPPAIDSPTPTIDTLTEAAVILTPATVAPIETAILPTWAIDPAAPTVSVTPTIITPPSEARRPDPAGILPAAAIVAPSETAILPTPAIDPIAPTLPSTPATITPPSEAISLTPAAILPIPAAILPIPAIDLAAPTLPSTPANITPPPVVGPPTVAVILPAPAIVAPSETTIIPTSAIDPAALPLPPSPSAILPTPAIQPSTQIQSPPPVLTVPIPIWHVDGTSSGDTSMVECDPKIHLEFNTVVLPNIQQLINKSLYKKKAFFCVELVMCEDRPTVLITCRSVRDMRRLIAKTNCIDQRKFSVKFLEGGVSYAAAPGGSNLFGNGMYRSGSGIPISAYRGKRTLGTALLGGYIEIDGQYFGLTVSHVLDEETEDSDSGETSDQSSDRTSSTSSSTRISDDDDDDDDGDRRLKPRVTEDHIELSDIRISVRDDHKMTAVHCASGNRVSRSANTGVDHRDATSYIMDWALISPPQMVGAHFHPPNVFHDAQTDSRGSDASHPIISTGHLASKSVKIIMNGSVYCHGTASGVPSLVSLRNQPGLGLVFMVMTSRELGKCAHVIQLLK